MLSSHDLPQEERDLQRSSQESLPLSQETFQTLVNGLFELGNASESVKNATDLSRILEDFPKEKLEMVGFGSNLVGSIPRPSSVPPVSDWPGDYDFRVYFENEPLSKKVNWTYSTTHNRLYVKKDQMCPINFATDRVMGLGFYIRVMLVYSEPQYSTEVVKRCINHSMQEIAAGVFEAEHVIRAQSSTANYIIDNNTQRHSVIFEFEDPTAGQNFSSYLFQFVCFNSCTGGPNRRPMTIVFTLEKINYLNTFEVVGRKCFGLKVCACPGRDRITDEGHVVDSERGPPPKKKFKENHVVSTELSSKSRKKPRKYNIEVKDEDTFNFLTEMKKVTDIRTRGFLIHMKNCRVLYELSKEKHHFAEVLNAYVNYRSSNSDERSEDE